MPTERIRKRIDQLLDEVDQAIARLDWTEARDRALAVLALDPENHEASSYLAAADRALVTRQDSSEPKKADTSTAQPAASLPTSFANGRYQVKKLLGEGGKKKVYLAHDTELDRDVAFALIKTEKVAETELTVPKGTDGCKENILR
jgi:hypothetical protein